MATEEEAHGRRPQKDDDDAHRDENERDHAGDAESMTAVRS
jgi:hypothetical protein